jgi:hypothetical protein
MTCHFILFPVISNHRADNKDNTIVPIYCNDSFIDFGLTCIGKSLGLPDLYLCLFK